MDARLAVIAVPTNRAQTIPVIAAVAVKQRPTVIQNCRNHTASLQHEYTYIKQEAKFRFASCFLLTTVLLWTSLQKPLNFYPFYSILIPIHPVYIGKDTFFCRSPVYILETYLKEKPDFVRKPFTHCPYQSF